MEWLNNISEDIIPNNITNKEEKLEVARKVAEKVKDGDVIGFGSGSTSYLAARKRKFKYFSNTNFIWNESVMSRLKNSNNKYIIL